MAKHPDKLLRVGIIGTVIAALCCFTPILVVLLGMAGMSALAAYLDFVLLPVLAIFLGLTVYALWRRKRDASVTHEQKSTSSDQKPH